MAVAPACFSRWGFSSSQPDLSLLCLQVLREVVFPLLWQVSKTSPTGSGSGARWGISHHMHLLPDLCFVWRVFHLTITQCIIMAYKYTWMSGLCYFPAKEPNRNSFKKASSSVSSLSVLTTNTITHIYKHVFNKVTFIHVSRVQEHVITDQNNKKDTHF